MELVERHPLKEKRRANKPLLERKRRAKINDSLSDLKNLVLSSLNKDVSKYAKMEKVDILDMTVQFLKSQCVDKRKDDYSSVYRAGYSECTKEMYQSIMTMEGIDHIMKCRILSNLAINCRPEEKIPSPPPSPTFSNTSRSPIPSPTGGITSKPCISTIFNPSSRHVVVPMVTPRNTLMPNIHHNDHGGYNTIPETVAIRTVLRPTPKQQITYCTEHVAQKNKSRSTQASNVWRPW